MSHTFLHSHLRQTFRWYDSWHDHPGHPYIHWLSFLVLSLSIFSYAHHLTSDFNYGDNNFLKINTAQAQGADAFNLGQAVIVNSTYDPRNWGISTSLSTVLLNNQTVPITSTNVFDQWFGSTYMGDSNNDGITDAPITHTLWMFFNINGTWHGSGLLGYYCNAGDRNGNLVEGDAGDGCDTTIPSYSVVHGSIVDGNCGWYYNNSWAPMHNYPIRQGDPIGFMVTAGAGRIGGAGSNISERSNVITIPSPYDLPTSCPGESTPTPTSIVIPRNIYFTTPYALQAGQVMTIFGQNLTPNINFYNSANTLAQATGTMNTDATEVVVVVPASLVPGLYNVSVGPNPESNRAQLEVLLGTYTPGPSGPQVPIISSINPVVASPGDIIEIIGEYLSPVIQFVSIGGGTTTVTGSVSPNYQTATVTVPSGINPGIYNIGIVGEFGTAVSADVLTIVSTDTPISAASIPQPTAQATSFQDLISRAFNYSLIVVGIAVFIMIMWGGFLWLTSAANPGNIATAKRYIFNAILGAVLLISAYVILNTINPELVGGSLTLPGIEAPISAIPPSPANCSDTTALASKYNVPAFRRNSADLEQLMFCISNSPSLAGIILGSPFTYDVNHEVCNYTRGLECGPCSHAANSCHYGGSINNPFGNDGAMAVDYGNAMPVFNSSIGNSIKSAALSCGAKSARCERGSSEVDCSLATHVHVNSELCDRN